MSEGRLGDHTESEFVGSSRGPHGRNEGKKVDKTRSASEKRNNLASERGHIKHTERYQVPQGMDNSSKETKRWSSCVDW